MVTVTLPKLAALDKIIGQGTVELSNSGVSGSWLSATTAFGSVALNNAQPDTSYAVVVDIEEDDARIGNVVVYDKATNGFKVKYTGGAAGPVTARWTALNTL